MRLTIDDRVLKQLPHLEHYGTPIYFIYLILALLPIFVGLFFKKRFPVYMKDWWSLIFIILMLTGSNLKTNLCPALLRSLANLDCIFLQDLSSESGQQVDFLSSFLLVCLALIFVKVEPAIKNGHQSLFGF